MKKKLSYQDLIVVGGAPRSGTTLVQNILDSHPSIYGGPEFGNLPAIVRLRRQMIASVRSGAIDQYVSESEIDAGLRDLVLGWLSGPACAQGATRIAEKTPGNAVCMDEILDIFPDGIGVHVVRDPRSVLVSMMRVKKRYEVAGRCLPERLLTLQAMAETIANHFLGGMQASDSRPDRTIVVRYEDLVLMPETTIKRLCAAIHVEFYSEMLTPSAYHHDSERLVLAGTPWYTQDEFYRNIDPSRADAWRYEIEDDHIQALLEAFGPDCPRISQMGYVFT